MTPETITSLQNLRIKRLIALQQNARRKKEGLVLIEGRKETEMAIAGGVKFTEAYFCPALTHTNDQEWLHGQTQFPVFAVSEQVFAKIAYRETTGGMVLVGHPVQPTLSTLTLSAQPLVLVVEKLEKPGNLGAILRTADAARADAVLVCDPSADPYNPNVVRASLGCVFTRQVVATTNQSAYQWLKEKGITIAVTSLEARQWYHEKDFRQPTALVMGSEAHGISAFWEKSADWLIKIPMLGSIDSMNVSVATAILTFEVLRQRNFYQP